MPRVVHVVGGDASFQTATGYLLKQAGYEVASYPSAQHFLDHLPNESVGAASSSRSGCRD